MFKIRKIANVASRAVLDTFTQTYARLSRKRVHGKETKGRCTCVHVCVCVCITCVKADPECVSRPLQITLAPRKSQLDSFFSFLFPSFSSFSFFFTFSFSDHLIQATTSSNLVIHFSFPDKRSLSILTFDEFRRDTDVANGNHFKQGTRIALFFYIGERGNKTKKGKSFERRAGRQILLLKKCECKRKFKLMNIFV